MSDTYKNISCEKILNYKITSVEKSGVLEQIQRWIERSDCARYFVCANPHSLQVAKKDAEYNDAILHADLVIPDGVGIILASRVFGGDIRERVTGSDIFWGLSEHFQTLKSGRYFFLGSSEYVLKNICKKMAHEFPNIEIVGTYSPPFKADFSVSDNNKMIEIINAASPDVLWVGMTAPKQEKWIYRHKDRLNVKFIGAIGAVFDFYAGNVKRPHPVFQSLGLEWLPRLVREPRRLWKRTFISGPSFLLRICVARVFS